LIHDHRSRSNHRWHRTAEESNRLFEPVKIETMKAMTKNQFIEYAKKRNVRVSYSGKLRKFFFTYIGIMDINAVINSKP